MSTSNPTNSGGNSTVTNSGDNTQSERAILSTSDVLVGSSPIGNLASVSSYGRYLLNYLHNDEWRNITLNPAFVSASTSNDKSLLLEGIYNFDDLEWSSRLRINSISQTNRGPKRRGLLPVSEAPWTRTFVTPPSESSNWRETKRWKNIEIAKAEFSEGFGAQYGRYRSQDKSELYRVAIQRQTQTQGQWLSWAYEMLVRLALDEYGKQVPIFAFGEESLKERNFMWLPRSEQEALERGELNPVTYKEVVLPDNSTEHVPIRSLFGPSTPEVEAPISSSSEEEVKTEEVQIPAHVQELTGDELAAERERLAEARAEAEEEKQRVQIASWIGDIRFYWKVVAREQIPDWSDEDSVYPHSDAKFVSRSRDRRSLLMDLWSVYVDSVRTIRKGGAVQDTTILCPHVTESEVKKLFPEDQRKGYCAWRADSSLEDLLALNGITSDTITVKGTESSAGTGRDYHALIRYLAVMRAPGCLASADSKKGKTLGVEDGLSALYESRWPVRLCAALGLIEEEESPFGITQSHLPVGGPLSAALAYSSCRLGWGFDAIVGNVCGTFQSLRGMHEACPLLVGVANLVFMAGYCLVDGVETGWFYESRVSIAGDETPHPEKWTLGVRYPWGEYGLPRQAKIEFPFWNDGEMDTPVYSMNRTFDLSKMTDESVATALVFAQEGNGKRDVFMSFPTKMGAPATIPIDIACVGAVPEEWSFFNAPLYLWRKLQAMVGQNGPRISPGDCILKGRMVNPAPAVQAPVIAESGGYMALFQ